MFTFDTLKGNKLSIPLQPKAIHDEMNAASFDEFGRMTANLGVEAVPATPAAQNVTLYPYVNPQTELIDGTNLPTGDIKVTPISKADDGTQIWKITHNGVDTHPIHFHLYDVQVLNRVTWDNIIIPPDASELGGRTRSGSARSRTRSSRCGRSCQRCRSKSQTASGNSTQ